MFVALEHLIRLEEGYRRVFQIDRRHYLLIVVENQPILLENSCPHQGASLHNATLDGRVLRCARHGMAFDLHRGVALDSNCPPLRLLPLAYDGDRVGLDL
ncbi:Rieske (2Fe-2S) protein [Pseudomonas sp. RIT-PI-AD]|uniref:Rieske (2Fe-2S) protein n=1 Tax=Pseudomonas sp. RIT-PI-AD TaxID=3035294 RepID=UPI0021D81B42|nr:Rieske (2Fe-2S) protein [Pseudomonas sp. RIT-PI-AD]